MANNESETNMSNPEEALLKELREADYTEEQEHEEDDFDIGDLECVDDEKEEDEQKTKDDRSRIKAASPERNKIDRRRLSDRDRDRYDPYSGSRRRKEHTIQKKHSPGRLARDKRRKQEYLEKKNASNKHSIRNKKNNGIDLDELEEVDSVDDTAENIPSSSSSVVTLATSPTTPLLEDDDPWTKTLREADETSRMLTLDDEDFPSLCEEIDPDILKKVAQTQQNDVSPQVPPSPFQSSAKTSLPSANQSDLDKPHGLETKETTSKSTMGSKHQRNTNGGSESTRRRGREKRHKNGQSESDRLPERRRSKERKAESQRHRNSSEKYHPNSHRGHASTSNGKDSSRDPKHPTRHHHHHSPHHSSRRHKSSRSPTSSRKTSRDGSPSRRHMRSFISNLYERMKESTRDQDRRKRSRSPIHSTKNDNQP